MTPFQMHLGRKPRTALVNLIVKPECLLSNWKRTLTNYISAQPTKLQVGTINDSEGGIGGLPGAERYTEERPFGKPEF